MARVVVEGIVIPSAVHEPGRCEGQGDAVGLIAERVGVVGAAVLGLLVGYEMLLIDLSETCRWG